MRAIEATHPDIVYAASYPPDTVGVVRAAAETGLETKLFGGALVGLGITEIKLQLGPLMNGMVNNELFLPAKTFMFPGTTELIRQYQERAKGQGVDPLGYSFPPFGYAAGQVLAASVTATASLDQGKLADYAAHHEFHTVVGDISFGKDGEWATSRRIITQFRNVAANDLDQFRDTSHEEIVWPDAYKTADMIFPYAASQEMTDRREPTTIGDAMRNPVRRCGAGRGAALAAAVAALIAAGAAQAADPIRIGCSMSLTGGVAANGKQILVSLQVWRDQTNAKGGLLGRPVELDCYDDQSNPATVPAIYTKLIEVDKVPLLVGPYATNMVVPAIPVLMQHDMLTVSILALDANAEFHYPRYFSTLPVGQNPKPAFSQGFFKVAMQQSPAPKTIAIAVGDAEFAQNAGVGARQNAKDAGLRIVYDKSYPPTATDYTPILRAIEATSPDIVYNASYNPDTVGFIRAASETGLTTKMFGGNMVGLLSDSVKMQLGPLLNGIVNAGELFVPAPSLMFPGTAELFKEYQARAPKEGTDPLGYSFVPYGFAALQIIGAAVEATKSLDNETLAAYMRGHGFKTVIGDVSYGENGEWKDARMLTTQYQNITAANDIEQFRDAAKEVLLYPTRYKSGTMIYPYETKQ